jgi:hypothetical protein
MFCRIELRSIGRKPFHMKPRIAEPEIRDRFSPVDKSFVP